MSEKRFYLSKMLKHRNNIRCLATTNNNVVTVSTCGIVTVWSSAFDSFSPFRTRIHQPNSLVLSLKKLAADDVFVSGASDNVCVVWDLKGNTHCTLTGHSGSVNSIDQLPSGDIITGSFDRSVKIWKMVSKMTLDQACVFSLSKTIDNVHTYGVEVCAQKNGTFVTASSGNIFIWSSQGDQIKKLEAAHKDPVRKIVTHPLGFASCANDGFLKIWTENGDSLLVIKAHESVGSTPSFVYSLAVTLNRCLVSVGEDSLCKIWNQSGELVDCIRHPEPIREVISLKNGDFATTNGKRVFVFTADKERSANEALQEEFEVLLKNGVDQNSKNNNENQFDYVVHVELDNGKRLSLEFNNDDDPDQVAMFFCKKHHLDPSFKNEVRDHVAKFVRKNDISVNPHKKPRVNFKTLPIWMKSTYHIYLNVNVESIANKILEINTLSHSINEKELISFLDNLKNVKKYHVAEFQPCHQKVLKKLLDWPETDLYPILDSIRLLMSQSSFSEWVIKTELYLKVLKNFSCGSILNNVLICRIFCNFFAKLVNRKNISEKICGSILRSIEELCNPKNVDIIKSDAKCHLFLISLIQLLHNFVIYIGKTNEKHKKENFHKLLLICLLLFESFEISNELAVLNGIQTIGSIIIELEKPSNDLKDRVLRISRSIFSKIAKKSFEQTKIDFEVIFCT